MTYLEKQANKLLIMLQMIDWVCWGDVIEHPNGKVDYLPYKQELHDELSKEACIEIFEDIELTEYCRIRGK